MRAPCKAIRPSPEAIEAVKDRMRVHPYFTRSEVKLWFAEFDPMLAPLNAWRATDRLLADLRADGAITLLSMNRGWIWRDDARNAP